MTGGPSRLPPLFDDAVLSAPVAEHDATAAGPVVVGQSFNFLQAPTLSWRATAWRPVASSVYIGGGMPMETVAAMAEPISPMTSSWYAVSARAEAAHRGAPAGARSSGPR